MRAATAIGAAVAICLIAAGCDGSQQATVPAGPGSGESGSGAPTVSASVTRTSGASAPCTIRALVLGRAGPVSPMTGEHAVMYLLTNRGRRTCSVRGYPHVALYARDGVALRFRYADGGGPYVTARDPVTVVLANGASAYVLVAKYRCDLGIVRDAATIRLTLRTSRAGVFSQRQRVGVAGASGLSYCKGGRRDPGQLVIVSPVEPTFAATSSLP